MHRERRYFQPVRIYFASCEDFFSGQASQRSFLEYFSSTGRGPGPSWLWSYGSWIWNQCLSPLTLWVQIPLRRGELSTPLCDQVCQRFATGQWFSPVSSTNKTDRHNIVEILLKVALNTLTQTDLKYFSSTGRKLFFFLLITKLWQSYWFKVGSIF